jgi:L-fuconate dehydratase
VQHLSIIDYLVVSGELDGRVTEYVDHLHEHFVDPCIVKNGAYQLPSQPGYSAEMYATSIAEYSYPSGTYWRGSFQGQTPASSASGPSLSTKV